MAVDPNSRDEFLRTVRRALGRPSWSRATVPTQASESGSDPQAMEALARSVGDLAREKAAELLSELEGSAAKAGWKVARLDSTEQAARYVESLARKLGARSIVRSAHPLLDRLGLEGLLAGTGIELQVMATDGAGEQLDRQRETLRQYATQAGLGLTAVDYAVAETGSCVLLARKGVSRLVALVPPVHVAVVERGQVLPTLDELFVLLSDKFSKGTGGSYMNIISGPSRSADIEQIMVTGVHGPGEVHMLLLG